jgi:hypothetical protein
MRPWKKIADVRGVGDIIAQAVRHYLDDPSARELVTKLAERGLTLVEARRAAADGALRGMTVVITGTLPTLSQAQVRPRWSSRGPGDERREQGHELRRRGRSGQQAGQSARARRLRNDRRSRLLARIGR